MDETEQENRRNLITRASVKVFEMKMRKNFVACVFPLVDRNAKFLSWKKKLKDLVEEHRTFYSAKPRPRDEKIDLQKLIEQQRKNSLDPFWLAALDTNARKTLVQTDDDEEKQEEDAKPPKEESSKKEKLTECLEKLENVVVKLEAQKKEEN